MKKLLLVFAVVSCLFLSSCKDDDIVAVGDVYFVSQLSGQDTLYGLSIHVYSLYAFSSASVSPDSNSEIVYNLSANESNYKDFYYDTPDYDLTTEKPLTGSYHFSVTYENGKTAETDDVLYTNVLYPPVITGCSYSSSASSATISWNKVENADLYVLKVYEGDECVFLSSSIDPSNTRYVISASDANWNDDYSPTEGTTYTVRVSAFKYESDEDVYNVQASSIADEELYWGNK